MTGHPHLLCVGGSREFPDVLRELSADVRLTALCGIGLVGRLRSLDRHRRVIALGPDAPVEEWIEHARAVHRRDPFTRVVAFGEWEQDRAAAVAAALGVPAHSERTVKHVHDKRAMREELARRGVDTTPSRLVTCAADIAAFAGDHGYPCIVKPVSGAGSARVRRVDGPDEVAAAHAAVSAPGPFSAGGVLVESFHQGPQFSVEAFSEGGRHEIVCVTRKFSDPENFVELGHVAPAPLSDADREAITAHVADVLTALEIGFGPTHTEVVLTPHGPRLIETHLRLAGDDIPQLVREALGVDLFRYTARQALGATGLLDELRAELAEAGERTPRYAAIRYATAVAHGVVESVSGAEEARGLPQVDDVRLFFGAGDPLDPVPSSDSRLAMARAHGATPEEAAERAREAVAGIAFRSLLHNRTGTELI
ncbi:ATP-grasp domain-containing protein [Streptomyces sp. NPDC058326]|uniref:ATP-grasp domain-containing protein n=1 Tax=Streptomyces sp. NPDC058326 TaxID=3346447 RepID=UPI0036E677C0